MFVLVGIAVVLLSILVTVDEPRQDEMETRQNQDRNMPNFTVVVFGFEPGVTTQEFQHSHSSGSVKYVDYTEPYTVDENTFAVVINRSEHPDLNRFSETRIMGLAWEPAGSYATAFLTPEYQRFVQRRFARYLVSSLQNIQPGLDKFTPYLQFHPTHVPIPRETLTRDEWWDRKPHILSIILSPKKSLPGHAYRHTLCREMIRQNLPVHIYGGGSNAFLPFAGVKGPFEPRDTQKAYEPYKFHIAIENSVEPHYVTEKYLNAIALHAIPIYLGATQLDDYFGNHAAHKLAGNLSHDMTLLRDICQNPGRYWLDLVAARNAVLAGKANLAYSLKHGLI